MKPTQAMLRYPALSATHIAFVHAGDIWLADRQKAEKRNEKIQLRAWRLTSAKGEERFPRFSPDGGQIVFSANYDGNVDLYVMPVDGSASPRRLTHHPHRDRMLDWYPDGEHLLFASTLDTELRGFRRLYKVPVAGGVPEPLPIPFAEFASVHPDGETIAFQPTTRDFLGTSRWPGYRGGKSPDIWLRQADEKDQPFVRLTGQQGNEACPIWHPDGKAIYYLSDQQEEHEQEEHEQEEPKKENSCKQQHEAPPYYSLWKRKAQVGASGTRLTHFEKFDVRHPDIAEVEIIFEHDGTLYLFNLERESQTEIEVYLLSDRSMRRPRSVSVGDAIRNFDLSPSGRRAVFEARGDIFTVPRKHGIQRNLTRLNCAHRYPAWSPDGQWIAFWSDRDTEPDQGSDDIETSQDTEPEYQLYLQGTQGGKPQKIGHLFEEGFRYRPFWCPRSQRLAFIDSQQKLYYWDIETSTLVLVDADIYWMYHWHLERFTISWSASGRWLAYARKVNPQHSAIFLFDTKNRRQIQLTSGSYNDFQPTFDRGGRFLYFLTQRSFPVVRSDLDSESEWVVANSTQIAALPLLPPSAYPQAYPNEEDPTSMQTMVTPTTCECWDLGTRTEADGDETPRSANSSPEYMLQLLDVPAGRYERLQGHHGQVFYLRKANQGATDRFNDLMCYQHYQQQEDRRLVWINQQHSIYEGATDFVLQPHAATAGTSRVPLRLLVRDQKDGFSILQLSVSLKLPAESWKLGTDRLIKDVDPPKEWRQMLHEAWRLVRDYFPDQNLPDRIGWPKLRGEYVQHLNRVASRWDLDYLIADLLGHIGLSHFSRRHGDFEVTEKQTVGMLGADFAAEIKPDGKRGVGIRRILDGGEAHCEVRSPLGRAGVRAGEFLLAINDITLSESENPWQVLQGQDGRTVLLRVSPDGSVGQARTVRVKTLNLRQEMRLRQLAWIEKRRSRVDTETSGRVSYIHLSDTGSNGQLEFLRQLRPQAHREGLILDNRFNQGGNYPDPLIEILSRRQFVQLQLRAGESSSIPPLSLPPKQVMLVNGWTGSNGELLAHLFQESTPPASANKTSSVVVAAERKLVGSPTLGGLLGVSGTPTLIDSGAVSVPDQIVLSHTGEWLIEGQPVEPNPAEEADFARLARDTEDCDNQLERAIEEILAMLPPQKDQ